MTREQHIKFWNVFWECLIFIICLPGNLLAIVVLPIYNYVAFVKGFDEAKIKEVLDKEAPFLSVSSALIYLFTALGIMIFIPDEAMTESVDYISGVSWTLFLFLFVRGGVNENS